MQRIYFCHLHQQLHKYLLNISFITNQIEANFGVTVQ